MKRCLFHPNRMSVYQKFKSKLPDRKTIKTYPVSMKAAFHEKSNLLLLNILSLSKQAIHNREAVMNKSEMSDYFYKMTGVGLSDIKAIEYRSPRKNTYKVDPKENENLPAWIRFTDSSTGCNKSYE